MDIYLLTELNFCLEELRKLSEKNSLDENLKYINYIKSIKLDFSENVLIGILNEVKRRMILIEENN